MNKKQKHKLINWMLISYIIFFIIFFLIYILLWYHKKSILAYRNYKSMLSLFFTINVVFGGAILLLMRWLYLAPEHVSPTIFQYSSGDTLNKLKKILLQNNYAVINTCNEYSFPIYFTYIKKRTYIHIVILIQIEQISDSLFLEFEKNSFQQLEKHFKKQKIYKQSDKVYITYIIITDKYNENFSRYIESNYETERGKYIIPIGICNEYKKIYIGNQPSNYIERNNKKIRKKIQKYMKKM